MSKSKTREVPILTEEDIRIFSKLETHKSYFDRLKESMESEIIQAPSGMTREEKRKFILDIAHETSSVKDVAQLK